ncbi:MAG: hypothetical protein OEV53_07365 [Nitrospira sp.]|nr:hypothetical protein [Nitrospira sp.]MDH5194997.1 hypothetical protein [Nitrospira sp.]
MPILLHMLAGLMLGYVMTTLLESSLHRVIYHAGPQTRRFLARYPRISGPFRRAYFFHEIVHHRWTFRKNFVTQFSSRQEQERLDQRLRGAQASLIRREQYGVTLRGERDSLVQSAHPAMDFADRSGAWPMGTRWSAPCRLRLFLPGHVRASLFA